MTHLLNLSLIIKKKIENNNVALLGKAEMFPLKVSWLSVEFPLHTTRTSYVAADIIPSRTYFDDVM